MNRDQHAIATRPADFADTLLIECCCSLGRSDRLDDVMRMVQTFEGSRSFSGLVELEAVTHVGERAVCGKLCDGVIILAPEFARALLTKVDAFPSGTKSGSSPANWPVATSAVAGKPDRAVVAQVPKAVVTPSATPIQ